MPTTTTQQELLDIPDGTRNLLILTAVVGLIIAVVASLEGGKGTTLEVDKILHFMGYAALAAVFVLALRPKAYVPALTGLIALGIGIEFIQPLNSRGFEIADMLANAVGVGVGAGGLVLACEEACGGAMGGDARHTTLFAAINVGGRHPVRVLLRARGSGYERACRP